MNWTWQDQPTSLPRIRWPWHKHFNSTLSETKVTVLNKWIRWDKDLNSVSLTACDYPGTIGLEIWLQGQMNLINCLSVLGFAWEPAVITINQDLKVKELGKVLPALALINISFILNPKHAKERRANTGLYCHMVSQFICILSSSPCTHNSNTNSMVL